MEKEVRNHKVKCQYGIQNYYQYYKENSDSSIDSKLYSLIVNEYLKANKNAISNFGYTFDLPQRMGRIQLRKIKKEIKIDENGNIINKLPINWKATKKLWNENEKAKLKKILIRYTNEHTHGFVFRIVYVKNLANYKNKSIYKAHINREMRRNTEKGIMNKRLDAFLLNTH